MGHRFGDCRCGWRMGVDLETEYPVKGETCASNAVYDGDGNSCLDARNRVASD